MIGEALRLIRKYHDVSLTELAKNFDMSASYLSEIENGKKQPSLDIIERYAQQFQLKKSAIMFFSEEIEAQPRSKTKDIFRKNIIKFLKLIEGDNEDTSR
jgi:transcriptional regulator with XRE-family HTH domain